MIFIPNCGLSLKCTFLQKYKVEVAASEYQQKTILAEK